MRAIKRKREREKWRKEGSKKKMKRRSHQLGYSVTNGGKGRKSESETDASDFSLHFNFKLQLEADWRQEKNDTKNNNKENHPYDCSGKFFSYHLKKRDVKNLHWLKLLQQERLQKNTIKLQNYRRDGGLGRMGGGWGYKRETGVQYAYSNIRAYGKIPKRQRL